MRHAIDACLVFDDHRAHLTLRQQQVAGALSQLADQGEVALRGPISGFTSRAELLWSLDEMDAGDGRILVVSDLFADTKVESGAIGARILRAIAQHPVWGPRTRRVVLTEHMVEPVLDGLKRYVHAYSAFGYEHSAGLAPAILDALDAGEDHVPLAFPAARTPEQWHDELAAIVEELVDKPMVGDERIVIGLTRHRAVADINADLDRARAGRDESDPPVRKSVMSFITAVEKDRELAGASRAHALIRQRGGRIALQDLDDGLPYEECDRASRWWKEQHGVAAEDFDPRAAGERHALFLRTTWLTPDEEQLARTFLGLYGPRTDGMHKTAETAKLAVIRKIKGTSRDAGDPAYLQVANALSLDQTDLAYAIWAISDVREGR